MDNSSLYYSSSILNAYLNDGNDLCVNSPIERSAEAPIAEVGASHKSNASVSAQVVNGSLDAKKKHVQLNVPQSSLLSVPQSSLLNIPQSSLLIPQSSLLRPLSAKDSSSSNTRASVVSGSTYNSLYSSISNDTADLDLESVKLPFDKLQVSKPKTSRLKRIQQFLIGENEPERELDDNAKFIAYTEAKLHREYYSYEDTAVLKVDFVEAAEVLFFGETLPQLFPKEQSMVHYLMQSSFELGEVRFSNLNRFHSQVNYDIHQLLVDLQPQLATFNDILDLYAASNDNINRAELFETFSSFANEAKGLCIPLAISMFGNWLLTFNRDSAVESNYENDLILDYFRKLIRLALVVRRLGEVFDKVAQLFTKKERIDLTRYWRRDNLNALATSLHSLGEYYQFNHEYDKAVTIWEINCHLTEDSESGNLATLGLTDGYGFGNLCKKQNRFGHHSKKHRFNTKRRIAHIYRILMKKPDFDEFGVSWATKEKYD